MPFMLIKKMYSANVVNFAQIIELHPIIYAKIAFINGDDNNIRRR